MRSILITAILGLFFTSNLQAKRCSQLIKNDLGILAYRCPDGSVSFKQPSSKPLKLNLLKLGAELATMMIVPKLESFPDQYRDSKGDVGEEDGFLDDQPSNTGDGEELTDSPKSIKDILKEYSRLASIAEGRCGQTAASNVFVAYCGNNLVSPKLLAKEYFHDSAPGVHPSTLTLGLNKMFKETSQFCQQGRWNYYYSKNKFDFLDSLYHHTNKVNAEWSAKSPLIVLLTDDKGQSLHYVTVTNIEGYCPEAAHQNSEQNSCVITYNDHSSQTRMKCSRFVKMVEDIQENKLFNAVIKKYPRIVFKSSQDSE